MRRELKRQRSKSVRREEQRLLVKVPELPDLAKRNFKFRKLLGGVIGRKTGRPLGTVEPRDSLTTQEWPFLWCAPTYRYWTDGLFEPSSGKSVSPSKFLVFSHWRFVPGAIALLTSQHVERVIGCRKVWDQGEPLRFRNDLSFGLFDVCFPSAALAAMVDPTAIALRLHQAVPTTVRLTSHSELVRAEAEREFELKLKEGANVRVSRGRLRSGLAAGGGLWHVVARLDARYDSALLAASRNGGGQLTLRRATGEYLRSLPRGSLWEGALEKYRSWSPIFQT